MKTGTLRGPDRRFLRTWTAALGVGLAVFLLLISLQQAFALKSLERTFRDWRIRIRPQIPQLLQAPPHRRSEKILLVRIDDATLQAITEPMLFWTGHFASVLGALDRAGATVVSLDIQFQVSGEDYLRRRFTADFGRLPDNVEGTAGGLARGDLALFQALCGGRVLLLAYIRSDGVLQGPWPPYRHAAGDGNLALGNVEVDPDGVIRRQFLYRNARLPGGAESPFYHLSFLTACRALGVEPSFVEGELRLGKRPIPHDGGFRFEVNYLGPPGTFLDGPAFAELVERAESGDGDWFARHFHGRVVLIGPAYSGSSDLVVTPSGGDRNGEMFGVELQANALNTLLNGDFLTDWPAWAHLTVLMVFCLGGAAICRGCEPGRAGLILAASAALWVAAGILALSRWNLWVELSTPLLALPAVFTGVFTWRYRTEYRNRRHIRRVLGRYVSENVAQEILKDPSRLELGGARQDVTILFCDLNGFTDMCEKLEPERIISTLNDYFTRMERVIFRHGGTLKQFVGDEIMVICGAPAADPSHAATACRIALDMETELLRWRRERQETGRPVLDAKFGIHSGPVVAGNVGSPNRAEYATVGDVVNTASRIMGLSRITGRRILVSEETRRLAGDGFAFEDMGLHEVKGRSRPVRTFALGGESRKSEDSSGVSERK